MRSFHRSTGTPEVLRAAPAGESFDIFRSVFDPLRGRIRTREERVDSLIAIRDLHKEYGHIQEVIIQNFRAKPDTRM